MFLLPGRLRIAIKGLRGNRLFAGRIEDTLKKMKSIEKACANPYTGRVLVIFDEAGTDASSIEAAIQSIRKFGKIPEQPEEQNPSLPIVAEKRSRVAIKPLLVLGGGMVAVWAACHRQFARQFVKKNRALVGASVFLSALIILGKGYRQYRQTKQINSDLVLGMSALASLLMRQAPFGLFITLLALAAEQLEAPGLLYKALPQQARDTTSIEKQIWQRYRRIIRPVALLSVLSAIILKNPAVILASLAIITPYTLSPSIRALMAAMADQSEKRGIIIHSPAKAIQASKLDTVVLTHTDILTQGNMRVQTVIPEGTHTENQVLTLAASCGQKGADSSSRALVSEAQDRRLAIKHVYHQRYDSLTGLSCLLDQKEILIANRRQLRGHHLYTAGLLMNERRLRHSGQYPLFIVHNHKVIGMVGLRGELAAQSLEGLEALRETGIRSIHLLSEENPDFIESIARDAGLDQLEGHLGDQDRHRRIEEWIGEGRSVAVITHKPYTAKDEQLEHLSILIDPAGHTESYSDIVLTQGDLRDIRWLIDLGKYANQIMQQNVILTLGLNAVVVSLVLSGALTPCTGLFMKLINSAAVLLNAKRVDSYKVKYLTSG